jgi:hypothetical protein
MRQKFNLDLTSLDRVMILIHGPYGAGKTHLQGDMLRWVQEHMGGPVGFLNIKGEDGASTLAGMGLGASGETVDTLKDYDEAIREYRAKGYRALAIDSLTTFFDLVLKDMLGEVRYPDPKLDGERAKMLWGQLKMTTKARVAESRNAANIVMWVAPYDRSEDPTGGQKGVTPDLPGKAAWGCGGWFDLVGLLTAEPINAHTIQRKVTFTPGAGVLTRQRLPRIITQPIVIPEGRGGWAAIYAALQAAITPTPQEGKKK